MKTIHVRRMREMLGVAGRLRLLVVGDVMLDQFLWGQVSRVSPEAPVPVVDFERESFMPGGAANVARGLTALGARSWMVGVMGRDDSGRRLRALLGEARVDCGGLCAFGRHSTSVKTRIIAHQQQVVRVDREQRRDLGGREERVLNAAIEARVLEADAVIVGDYGKGAVTQGVLERLRTLCRARGVWLSLDPKPVHSLDLRGLSLITPNRKETFELAGLPDRGRAQDPLADAGLAQAVGRLMTELNPVVLLVTLGEQGMLLCERGKPAVHIPTVAREVYDVSGAGDTVIGAFTLAIAAGFSALEAAIVSNHAAGVVVGKLGTAVVSPEELIASFRVRRERLADPRARNG